MVECNSTILVSGCYPKATISFEGHVGLISRAKCSASRQASAICPGERHQMMEIGRIQTNMEPLGSTRVKAGAEGWTERFQDLQSWCHQPPQGDLNTPQITEQDEFNFSVDVGNVKCYDDPSLVDVESDEWGTDLFGTMMGEENNNIENITLKTPYSNTTFETNSPPIKSPLKYSSENVLLSQTAVQNNQKNYDNVNSKVKVFKVPQKEVKERPTLKLNIAVATTSQNAEYTLSTPDVLKPVTDINDAFDLVNFVECGDDYEELLTESFDIGSVDKDHNYTGKVLPISEFKVKSEPQSPAHENELDDMLKYGQNIPNPNTGLTVVKRKRTNSELLALENDLDNLIQYGKNMPDTTTAGRVKKRRRDSESDYDYVLDDDFSSDDDSYKPGPSKKKPRQKRKSKEIKTEGSISGDNDKYRELRDKNNEASRRSRYNRKQRDVEMKQTADKLQKDNLNLKVKAERMQKLVLELRAAVLTSIKSQNSRNTLYT